MTIEYVGGRTRIALIPIPGSSMGYTIRLPQNAGDNLLTVEQDLIIKLNDEIVRLNARIVELEEAQE